MAPFRNTFSRPLSSGWKPAPSSSSADRRPLTVTDPLLGEQDPGQALQHRALARAVGPDDAEGGAVGHLEGHVLQGEELLVSAPDDRAGLPP